jgi:hypothetical protein
MDLGIPTQPLLGGNHSHPSQGAAVIVGVEVVGAEQGVGSSDTLIWTS